MECPIEVRDALLELLDVGLLRIRTFGWGNLPDKCAIEADHLHNLPMLLRQYSFDLVMFYWNTERTCFIKHCESVELAAFETAWARLAQFIRVESEKGDNGK